MRDPQPSSTAHNDIGACPRFSVRNLGLVAYEPTWRAMQAFNAARTSETADQLWLGEHPPVFTLGLAGRRGPVLAPGGIPVAATDPGGHVASPGTRQRDRAVDPRAP